MDMVNMNMFLMYLPEKMVTSFYLHSTSFWFMIQMDCSFNQKKHLKMHI